MNTREGAVRVYAEGPPETLEQFLRVLQQGPAGGRVQELQTTWGVATGTHSTFTIRPTL